MEEDDCLSDELADDEDREDAGDDWECAFPGECLMSYQAHQRWECCTVEMMEAMEQEQ